MKLRRVRIGKSGAIAAVALALLLGACASREEQAAASAQLADQLLQQGNPAAAAIEVRKALAKRDDVADYWILLARAEMTRRGYAGAVSAYLRALELDRGNLEALHALSELALAGGQLEDAEKYADQLLALNTQNVRALLVKGSIALNRKRFAEANDFADRVLTLDNGNEGGVLLRARILSAETKHGEAAALLEKALEEKGETPALLSGLLDIYRAADDAPNIARTYGRILTLVPDNIGIQFDYARELYRTGKNQEAYAVISELQAKRPDDIGLQGRIVDLWLDAAGEPVPQAEIDRLAAEGSPAIKVAVARYVLEKGKPAEAQRILAPFVRDPVISAANVEAHAIYALSQNALGQGGDALRRVNAVLAFDGTNARALLLRARILLAQGKLDQAVADAQILVRDNPTMLPARLTLAQIYVRRKQGDLANAAYQDALKDFPGNPNILVAYLDYLMAAGKRWQALDAAETFTRRNPKLAAGWKARAAVCVMARDSDCAAASASALKALGAIGTQPAAAPAGARTGALGIAPTASTTQRMEQI
uniref:tetratricopeptide repeat protein n=1 Tax=Edaphosphingomonas laterariae TaxID=861865 RepID=UPI0015C588D0|nr:tetratricopeptide repeat protein [Sphingomonas laterariae]